ncbi:hypothetical protein F183_A45400 [Bryobacterales bacterium F-183]|nr:hypothetical protein F183_A45400 [Bryobacterales bacterium F-183]
MPGDKQEPDPTILSLAEMHVKIAVVNGHAKVNVRQVFQNRKPEVMEGTYTFALPAGAAISDFAVWDDVTRIPGVILERKRAEELYEEIRAQAIDPGLLQQGERGEDEARRSAVFLARIVPIPGYGNKRLEIEYRERIAIENLKGRLTIPLRPSSFKQQSAARFTLELDITGHHKFRDFQTLSKAYPLKISERTPNRIVAKFDGTNVAFTEDFTIEYALDATRGDAVEVATYRENSMEPGFFEAQALLAMNPAVSATPAAAPRTVVALFDASLSMQWEKLERSFQALEAVLRRLTPNDKFNVLVYNETVASFAPNATAATPAQVDAALAFVKSLRLRGGTNLKAALDAGLAQTAANNATPESYLIVLGDGGATRGSVHTGKLAEAFATKWRAATVKPRVYVFGVGDDANLPLLRMLARNNGVFEWVRSSEPIDFKLNSFLSKIGVRAIDGLRLTSSVPVSLVYPLQDTAFPGSNPAWVGQFQNAAARAEFSVTGNRDNTKPLRASASTSLPGGTALNNDYLPREWAKARVDALLEKIDRDGEDAATIDEIIRLSRKYKFVTPYTSFLAAPRALLRPRLIRPGDPVLRIKTDPSIKSVVAMFPFGLVKPLRYLDGEQTWQTRFLAPPDMREGTYHVQLLLKDKAGNIYRESKSFVIASQAPVVRVSLDKARYKAGESMKMRVSASASTRTIAARMPGAAPVFLRWSADDKSNTGAMTIPAHLPVGKYTLTVTAEDFAHNIGSQEVSLEVIP